MIKDVNHNQLDLFLHYTLVAQGTEIHLPVSQILELKVCDTTS